MELNYTAIGSAIAAERKNLRMTQGSLAAKIGVVQSIISRIELGYGRISLEHAIALADFFEVPLEDLLKGALRRGDELVGQRWSYAVEASRWPGKCEIVRYDTARQSMVIGVWDNTDSADRIVAVLNEEKDHQA